MHFVFGAVIEAKFLFINSNFTTFEFFRRNSITTSLIKINSNLSSYVELCFEVLMK